MRAIVDQYLDDLADRIRERIVAGVESGTLTPGGWPGVTFRRGDLPDGFAVLDGAHAAAVLDYAAAVAADAWPIEWEPVDDVADVARVRRRQVATAREFAAHALDGYPLILPGGPMPPGWLTRCERRLASAVAELNVDDVADGMADVAATVGGDVAGATERLAVVICGRDLDDDDRERIAGWVADVLARALAARVGADVANLAALNIRAGVRRAQVGALLNAAGD